MQINKINDENTKIVLHNSLISIIIKGSGIIVALLTTPAYMRYFQDNEILGLWFTMLSVLSWILNCDLGIGNGLRNHLVYAIKKGDENKAKSLVSSAYLFLIAVGFAILVLSFALGRLINWNIIFNINEEHLSKQIMTTTMSILFTAIVLQIVLRMITSILYAMQKAFIPGLLSLITNVAMLFFVLISNHLESNNSIISLAVCYLISVNLPLALSTVIVFKYSIPSLKPAIKNYDKELALVILKTGSAFLCLQLVAMIIDNTNNYLITILVNNTAVVEYQVYYKIFSLPLMFTTLIMNVYWSIITKAKAENNNLWLLKNIKRLLFLWTIISIGELLIIPLLQILINIWLADKAIIVDKWIALCFAINGSIMVLRVILTNFANGLEELKVQMIYMTIGAIINIPLAFLLTQIYNNYISVVVANSLSVIPYCIIQLVAFKRRFRSVQ